MFWASLVWSEPRLTALRTTSFELIYPGIRSHLGCLQQDLFPKYNSWCTCTRNHVTLFSQIPLNPTPWHDRWERKELKGAILPPISEKRRTNAEKAKKPWEKYDLMKQYRETINDHDTENIMSEVHTAMKPIEKQHSRQKMTTRGRK